MARLDTLATFALAALALPQSTFAAVAEPPAHLPLHHERSLSARIPLEMHHDSSSSLQGLDRRWTAAKGSLAKRGETGILPLGGLLGSYRTAVTFPSIPDSPSAPVLLDTASSDLWFEPKRIATDKSTSYKAVPDVDFAIQYAGGEARGPVGIDRIALGNFTVDQAFVSTNASTVSLDNTGVAGVLGLGFQRLSRISKAVREANLTTLGAAGFNVDPTSNISIQSASSPLVLKLAQLGQVEAPIFGLSLGSTNGTLTLGAIDANAVAQPSDIEFYNVATFPHPIAALNTTSTNGTSPDGSPTANTTMPVATNGTASPETSIYLQWALPLTGLTVNGTAIQLNSTFPEVRSQPLALIESGSTGIYGPPSAVSAIFDSIPYARYVGENTWAMPCDSTLTMTFTFGGKSYSLGPESYLIGRAQGADDMCLAFPMALDNTSDGIDWVLGTRFLQNVYAVFSYGIDGSESPKVGFAQSRQPVTSPTGVASLLSTLAAAPTTLPNVLLSDPVLPTQSYVYNNSLSYATAAPSVGQIDSTELGASTYARLITGAAVQRLPLASLASSQQAPTAVGTAQQRGAGARRMGAGRALVKRALAVGVAGTVIGMVMG